MKVNGLTYSVDFKAQYEWNLDDAEAPFWDCIQISDIVVSCQNGEDVYDGFAERERILIDGFCIHLASKTKSLPKPPNGYDKRGS